MRRGMVAVTVAGMLAVGGTIDAEAGEQACSKTSKAARNACANEAKDDSWIARGICENSADEAERIDCRAAADASLAEAKEECAEQFDARGELCDALGEAPYDPVVDPAAFLSPEATAASPNPYLPLVPGTERVYRADGETVTVTVTDRTKEILGVTTIVVTDVVTDEEGQPIEVTDDWFAQDTAGNVWYFGEISLNFEDGEIVDVEGSWMAGVDGARPGIVMPAAPQVGQVYRQEFALGDAEDAAEVLSTTASAETPAASCDGDCLVTRDFTPLDPEAVEHKTYAPGIGLILELDPESGDRVELVSVTGP